jgi:hypothetical protein
MNYGRGRSFLFCSPIVYSVANETGDILVAGSHAGDKPFCLRVPRREGYFTGTGDLFSALLLAGTAPADALAAPGSLKRIVNCVLATLQAVLARTADFAATQPDHPRFRELRLVQSVVRLLAGHLQQGLAGIHPRPPCLIFLQPDFLNPPSREFEDVPFEQK